MSAARFTTRGPNAVLFHWDVLRYGTAARAFYMGSGLDPYIYGGYSVVAGSGYQRVPFPVRLLGWQFWQREPIAFSANVAYDLRRALDTVSLATWSHVSGTTLYTGALAVNLAANETLCVRHNNPGQAADVFHMSRLTVWGERLA